MTDQLKNILIGLFVVIAITIGISLTLFLEPTVGDGKQQLLVRFANVAGISTGTRVTFGGKVVGEVSSIKEVPNARELANEASGKVYLYQLTLKLDSSVKLYNTDEVAIRTTGLMGERSIAILPKVAAKGVTPVLITNEVLYANSIDPMENTMNQISKTAIRMQTAIDHFDVWFNQNKEELAAAIRSFDSALSRASTVLGSVESEDIVATVRQSADLLNKNLVSIEHALTEDQLLHHAAALVNNLNQAVHTDGAAALRNINQITHNISAGTGTIGKFINSEDFYLRLSSIMGKVETLMTDINHYGVLFQYNKGWQRSRTKRANAMNALDTPSEFRSYFENEVSTIQTSLGRLTELLSRAENTEERQKVVQSEPFKRDFGSLLRQVQGLTDAIKLYNEELVSPAGNVD